MTEYIIEIPDEYFASYDTERDMYYPDERDSAMPITPFVRCGDCKNFVIVDEIHGDYDDYPICGCRLLKLSNARIDDEVQEPQDPDGFCAWGTRRGE